MSRLDDIRARVDAATPGPWEPDSAVRGDCVVWGPNGKFIANQQAEPHWIPDPDGKTRAVVFDVDRRDCEFIAHAREDIPWLLAQIDRLNAKLAEAWDEGQRAAYDLPECAGLCGACEDCLTPAPTNPYREAK